MSDLSSEDQAELVGLAADEKTILRALGGPQGHTLASIVGTLGLAKSDATSLLEALEARELVGFGAGHPGISLSESPIVLLTARGRRITAALRRPRSAESRW